VTDSIAACPAPRQVIIFRSCTPLAVTLCDYIFLGREMPSKQSAAALLTIAAGNDRSLLPPGALYAAPSHLASGNSG
jgi:hypothetical protein